jgi:hypothetical protein
MNTARIKKLNRTKKWLIFMTAVNDVPKEEFKGMRAVSKKR